MQDSSLFANEQHPARRVIDRMGQAVLGLPSDVSARHPVCARLFDIATQLRGDNTGGMAAFEKAAAQLEALLAERNTAITEAAKPYLRLVEQLERRDDAAGEVRPVIEKFIATNPPPVIRNFIEQTGSQLLQANWLEHGEQSSAWQESLTLIEDLLWTIQPKADSDERKTLARRLPDILKRLRAGMQRVGLSPEAESAFLDACFELQTKALRALPLATSGDPGAELFPRGVFAAASPPVSGQLGGGETVLATLDFAELQPAPTRPLPCKEGDWLEFRMPDGEKRVARVCRISPNSQRVLLVNPDSALALAVHPAIVGRQLRDGEARISSACSLFETAASAALRQTTGG